jgi:diphthamide synthase (EF-2-diphthine--ammonia ligase)
MRLAALISGGKDSLYAAYLAKRAGHELACVVSMLSDNPDSYMWHVPNARLAKLQAELMCVPLVQVRTAGEKERELADLKSALAKISPKSRVQEIKAVKPNAVCPRCGAEFACNPAGDCWCKTEEYMLPIKPMPGIKGCLCPVCLKRAAAVDGIVTGAVASQYQKSRIERIADELGLACLSPLWQCKPAELLHDMLHDGFEIMITAVAAAGLDESWLGRTLDEAAVSDLIKLSEKHRFSPVGEGGELETLVLDCPLFGKKIKVIEAEKKWDSSTRSGTLEINKTELVGK